MNSNLSAKALHAMKAKPVDVETWCRNFLAWTFIVVSVGIIGPFALLLPVLILRFFFSQNAAAAYGDFTCNWWSKSLCICYGISVDVHGLENVPKGSVVVACNHRSHVDIPAVVKALFSHVRFGFVLKKSLLKVPLWGWFLNASGYVPIDRKARGKDQLKLAKDRIREGRSVCIFVEGTRSKTHAFGRFKKGAATLALEAEVPLLPVTISGTGVLMPKGKWLVRHGKVRVDVHAPISTKMLSIENRKEITQNLERAIASEYRINLDGPPMQVLR